jgi:hypothetical protein
MELEYIPYNCLICDARIRAPSSAAGRKSRCPGCGNVMLVPGSEGQSAMTQSSENKPSDKADFRQWLSENKLDRTHATASKPSEEAVCSFCMCSIAVDESKTVCETCKLPFHKDCWEYNLGCSAYGCKGQNILKKGPDVRIDPRELRHQSRPAARVLASDTFPREYLHLLASVVCFFLGLLFWGIPSLICLCFVRQSKARHYGALILGIVVCLAGFIAGLTCSGFFWND